ncbi:hypothetical protein NC652_039768 [Populus alba x Populus x berolinensis]|nr:hypothetical protein NC652_039768 [Populus alba x Populus x berolinensis]
MAVDMTAGTDVAYEVDVADETWRLGSDVAVVMACLVRADMAVVVGAIDDLWWTP